MGCPISTVLDLALSPYGGGGPCPPIPLGSAAVCSVDPVGFHAASSHDEELDASPSRGLKEANMGKRRHRGTAGGGSTPVWSVCYKHIQRLSELIHLHMLISFLSGGRMALA